MILNFSVSIDVPSDSAEDQIPYIKKILLGRLNWVGHVKSVIYDGRLAGSDDTWGETIEKDAWARGQMEL